MFGLHTNECLEASLTCRSEGLALQDCPPLAIPRKHLKMVGDRTESWSPRTQGEGGTKRKENVTTSVGWESYGAVKQPLPTPSPAPARPFFRSACVG